MAESTQRRMVGDQSRLTRMAVGNSTHLISPCWFFHLDMKRLLLTQMPKGHLQGQNRNRLIG
jgi:hypothetical protein